MGNNVYNLIGIRAIKCLGISVENRLLFRELIAVTYIGDNMMGRGPLALKTLLSRVL